MTDINDSSEELPPRNLALEAIKARAEECKADGRYEAAAELYSLLIAILEV